MRASVSSEREAHASAAPMMVESVTEGSASPRPRPDAQGPRAVSMGGRTDTTAGSSSSPGRAIPRMESPLRLSDGGGAPSAGSSTAHADPTAPAATLAAVAMEGPLRHAGAAAGSSVPRDDSFTFSEPRAKISDATPHQSFHQGDSAGHSKSQPRLASYRRHAGAETATAVSDPSPTLSDAGITPFRTCRTGDADRHNLPGQASRSVLFGSNLEPYSPMVQQTPPEQVRQPVPASGETSPSASAPRPARGSLIFSPPSATKTPGGQGSSARHLAAPRTHERVDSGIGSADDAPLTATKVRPDASDTQDSPSEVDPVDDAGAGAEKDTPAVVAASQAATTTPATDGHGEHEARLLSAGKQGKADKPGIVPKPGHAGPKQASNQPSPADSSAAAAAPPRPGTSTAPPTQRARRTPLRPPHDQCVTSCCSAASAMPGVVVTVVLRVLPVVLALLALVLACVLPSTLWHREHSTAQWFEVSRGCVTMFAIAIVLIFWLRSFATAFWPQRGRLTYDQVRHLAALRVPLTPMGGGAVCVALLGPLYHAAALFALPDGVLPARGVLRAIASGILWLPVPPLTVDETDGSDGDPSPSKVSAYLAYWLVVAIALLLMIACLVVGGLYSLESPSRGSSCKARMTRILSVGSYGFAMFAAVPVCVKLLASVACVDVDVLRGTPSNATVVTELRSVVSPATDGCGSSAHVGNIVAASLVLYFLAGPMAWFLAARLRVLEKDDEPSTGAHCVKMDLSNVGAEVLTAAVTFTCVAVGYGGMFAPLAIFLLDLAALLLAWFSLPSSCLFLCGAWRSGRAANVASSGAALVIAIHKGALGSSEDALRREETMSTAAVVVMATWGFAVVVIVALSLRRWARQPGGWSIFELTEEGLSLAGVHF